MSSNQKRIKDLTTENELLVEKVKQLEAKHSELWKTIREQDVKVDEQRKQLDLWKSWNKESGTRHRSQLMTAHYLIEQVKNMGTHHEKEVACRFLLVVIDNLIKDGDSIPLEPEYLPF